MKLLILVNQERYMFKTIRRRIKTYEPATNAKPN